MVREPYEFGITHDGSRTKIWNYLFWWEGAADRIGLLWDEAMHLRGFSLSRQLCLCDNVFQRLSWKVWINQKTYLLRYVATQDQLNKMLYFYDVLKNIGSDVRPLLSNNEDVFSFDLEGMRGYLITVPFVEHCSFSYAEGQDAEDLSVLVQNLAMACPDYGMYYYHEDLHPGNILRTKDGLAVIDVDALERGNLHDVWASFLFWFGMDWKKGLQLMSAYIKEEQDIPVAHALFDKLQDMALCPGRERYGDFWISLAKEDFFRVWSQEYESWIRR